MGYALGVDLGTTYVAAAIACDTRRSRYAATGLAVAARYCFRVIVLANGDESQPSTACVRTASKAGKAPGELKAVVEGKEVVLSWNDETQGKGDHVVFRDGEPVPPIIAAGTLPARLPVTAGRACYQVQSSIGSRGGAGLVSPPSNRVCVP